MPELPHQATGSSADISGYEARRESRAELTAVTHRLIADFAGRLPAGTVIRHVAQARESLLAAGVRSGLAAAAEAMARNRLDRLLPAHAATG
jgi:hypothetical protein